MTEPSLAKTAGADPASARREAISTTDLTRRFGDLFAVKALNVSVPAGVIFGLLGPNGAGKSTTIKMLTTLLPATSGTALVSGFDINTQPRMVRRNIGYVPQVVSAEGGLSGYENLLLFAKLYGIPAKQRQERIGESLAFAGLVEAQHTLVQKYSGGMVRRLEIALAILHRPPVLVLDEPTVGLDPIARQAVWEHLQELRTAAGVTILISTHHMNEADSLCDLVAIMDHGEIRAVGSPAELKMHVGEDASLNDVFVHFAGDRDGQRGDFKDAVRTRHTARRLG